MTRKAKGEVVGGRYEIDELLGSGTQGSVYRARDLASGQWVALKVVHLRVGDETSRARLEREGDALERIDSDGVARVVGRTWDATGLLCLVTEYLEGRTLESALTERGAERLPDDEIARIVRGVAVTLEHAHTRGIVHRDVKPTNIFLCADGAVKLLDFGYVRVLGAGSLTAEGIVPGTPSYLAPEAVFGRGVDARSDVYSLAVVAYSLLAGELPFTGKTNLQVIERAQHGPRPSLSASRPDLPDEIDAFVERALAADPAARFDRPTALADALDYVLSLEPCTDKG